MGMSRRLEMKNDLMVLLMMMLVLSLSIGCGSPTGDPSAVLSFEDAVQEVYEMAGRTLFYSSDGRTMDRDVGNRATGPDEIPGVCTDYAIEFAYYWNEVKNYDESFGRAYPSWVPSNSSTFYIADVNFVPDGTSKIRETSGSFIINANNQEMDGVYRDTVVASIIYSGRLILHFGKYETHHMWITINIGDDWYDTEPTWWDTGSGEFIEWDPSWYGEPPAWWGATGYYPPTKINF